MWKYWVQVIFLRFLMFSVELFVTVQLSCYIAHDAMRQRQLWVLTAKHSQSFQLLLSVFIIASQSTIYHEFILLTATAFEWPSCYFAKWSSAPLNAHTGSAVGVLNNAEVLLNTKIKINGRESIGEKIGLWSLTHRTTAQHISTAISPRNSMRAGPCWPTAN